MKDLCIIALLLILLGILSIIGANQEAFTSGGTLIQLAASSTPDECEQGLYRCVNHRIRFGF
jgi:hypothetical protein